MKNAFIFCIVCILCFLAGVHKGMAREMPPVSFTHVSIGEGLSQSTIFSIAQDLKGNMWFATYDGLDKYDGYDFTVYRHSAENPENSSSSTPSRPSTSQPESTSPSSSEPSHPVVVPPTSSNATDYDDTDYGPNNDGVTDYTPPVSSSPPADTD